MSIKKLFDFVFFCIIIIIIIIIEHNFRSKLKENAIA